MDLKDVIANVKEMEAEAHLAYHAGHHDEAENYLGQIRTVIQAYFGELDPYASNVEKSATSEKPEETLKETQAKVSGPGVHPAVIAPAAAAQQIPKVPEASKPIQ